MSKNLLITGTDTDVGKTVLTISLVAYWQTYRFCQSLGLMKLMQTGAGDDELYRQLFSDESSLQIVTPLFFEHPLAPPLAATKIGKEVDLKSVWQALNDLQKKQDFVLIEALGGLGSPVTYELTVANIAADWHLPTILVVPVKLGAIAQAVANVALARSLNIELKGIILSCSQPETEQNIADLAPAELIQSLTQVPILGTIPFIDNLANKEKLAQTASHLDLELIFPHKTMVG
ncbi:MAG: dethiobiotin synthase [Xenococcaceae cyanobacterium MO_188.B32]|nr:dethiobiotin synthase [Xenococcaceae cyanobacterium MO_188.B32]